MDTTIDSKAERVEAPERIWVPKAALDMGGGSIYIGQAWDDNDTEYIRVDRAPNTRQRAEQAAVTVAERARRREMADIIAAEHRRRKLVKVIIGAEKERAGKLSDDKLIEHFVTTVLNGLPTGSYEEALADEITDRFSAAIGIERSPQ